MCPNGKWRCEVYIVTSRAEYGIHFAMRAVHCLDTSGGEPGDRSLNVFHVFLCERFQVSWAWRQSPAMWREVRYYLLCQARFLHQPPVHDFCEFLSVSRVLFGPCFHGVGASPVPVLGILTKREICVLVGKSLHLLLGDILGPGLAFAAAPSSSYPRLVPRIVVICFTTFWSSATNWIPLASFPMTATVLSVGS